MAKKLPKWLTVRGKGIVAVDPDLVYPLILNALGVKNDEIDQYWLETAYQCAKLAAQDAMQGHEQDPRPASALVILIEGGAERKERWALANHPAGRGIVPATKGREAKQHYDKVRNLLAA